MDKIKYRIKLLNLLNYLDNILLWYYNVIIKNSSNRIFHVHNNCRTFMDMPKDVFVFSITLYLVLKHLIIIQFLGGRVEYEAKVCCCVPDSAFGAVHLIRAYRMRLVR